MVTRKKLKLDLGCGDRKTPGYKGVDKFKTKSTDFVVDLLQFPWPWADGEVEEAVCSHFFEHIPGSDRPRFMDELHRVLKKGGKATIVVPYGNSNRAIQDFTHAWPPVVAESFLYFNKKWRDENKLTHGFYAMQCDFDFGYGFAVDNDVAVKSHEAQAFSVKHYVNAATDMQVTLTKR